MKGKAVPQPDTQGPAQQTRCGAAGRTCRSRPRPSKSACCGHRERMWRLPGRGASRSASARGPACWALRSSTSGPATVCCRRVCLPACVNHVHTVHHLPGDQQSAGAAPGPACLAQRLLHVWPAAACCRCAYAHAAPCVHVDGSQPAGHCVWPRHRLLQVRSLASGHDTGSHDL